MNRPFTMMLVAVSLDGKISPMRTVGHPNPVGPSLISPEIMSFHNSKRSVTDGIMVGLNCILLDDARLTLRDHEGKNPTRIVLDGLAEMPPTARVLSDEAPTIVCVSEDAPKERVAALRNKGVDVVVSGRGKFVDLPPFLSHLAEKRGIERLVVEGGGTLHRSMIADDLYDEMHLIVCPFVIGGADSITPVERKSFWPNEEIPKYRLVETIKMGDYIYLVYGRKESVAA